MLAKLTTGLNLTTLYGGCDQKASPILELKYFLREKGLAYWNFHCKELCVTTNPVIPRIRSSLTSAKKDSSFSRRLNKFRSFFIFFKSLFSKRLSFLNNTYDANVLRILIRNVNKKRF
jgi:hypothetical protein